jgi:hypothetical protein
MSSQIFFSYSWDEVSALRSAPIARASNFSCLASSIPFMGFQLSLHSRQGCRFGVYSYPQSELPFAFAKMRRPIFDLRWGLRIRQRPVFRCLSRTHERDRRCFQRRPRRHRRCGDRLDDIEAACVGGELRPRLQRPCAALCSPWPVQSRAPGSSRDQCSSPPEWDRALSSACLSSIPSPSSVAARCPISGVVLGAVFLEAVFLEVVFLAAFFRAGAACLRPVFRFAAAFEVLRDFVAFFFDTFFDFELLPRFVFAAFVRLFALRPLAGRPFILLSVRETCASNARALANVPLCHARKREANKTRVRKALPLVRCAPSAR